jgi:hypothetical protein
MTEQPLRQFGEAAKFMCSKRAHGNQPPRKPFLVQLEEARAEWKRRFSKQDEEKAGSVSA